MDLSEDRLLRYDLDQGGASRVQGEATHDPGFVHPTDLHARADGSFLLEDGPTRLVDLGSDLRPRGSVDIQFWTVSWPEGSGWIGGIGPSAVSGEDTILIVPTKSGADVVYALVRIEREHWKLGAAEYPGGLGPEIGGVALPEFGPVAENFFALSKPLMAEVEDRRYLLSYLDDTGLGIYELTPKPRRLTAYPDGFSRTPPLPPSGGRDDAASLYAFVESSKMPRGLYASGSFLYLLTREPSAAGTLWRLHEVDPSRDRLLRSLTLPTRANHVFLVPGPEWWAIVEKGAVVGSGRQPIPSAVLVPSGWIGDPGSEALTGEPPECDAAPAARVGLVVEGPTGEPVTGAEVELRTAPVGDGLLALLAAPSDRGRTGDDGAVDLPLPAVRKLLTVDHPGFAPWAAELSPEDRPDRIVLDPGEHVRGVVTVASEEAPTKAPDTSARLEGTVCASWREVRTDWSFEAVRKRCSALQEGGRFEIRGLGAAGDAGEVVDLVARADGFLPARRQIEVRARAEPIRLEVTPGVLLSGRVVDAGGAAVPGARLQSLGSASAAVSGPEGRFELATESLPASLVVSAPGHRSTRLRVEELPTEARPLLVSLDPAERITGVVVAEDGTVPPGAEIAWEANGAGERTTGRFTVDSENGAFSFDLPGSAEYLLVAKAHGFREESVAAIFVEPGESVDLGVLALAREAGVRGRVVDGETGEGLPGVSVELLPAGTALFQVVEAGLPSAVTDEDGRFALFGAGGGRHELRARRDGYATRSVALTVRRDEALSLEPIALDPGAELRLRLVDRSGAARDGLLVRIHDERCEVIVPLAEAVSGTDGAVKPFVLAAGRYRLEVEGRRLLLAQEIEIPPGAEELERELTVGGVDLFGVVTRHQDPVAGGTLTFTSALDPGNSLGKLLLRTRDGRSAAYGLSESGVSVAISPDGTFHVADAPSGLLFATWHGPGGTVHREVLIPDRPRAEIEIELGGVRVTGRVTSGSGVPVAGARLSMSDGSRRNVGEARSGDDGWFAFPDLVPGEHRLDASAEGYVAQSLGLRVDHRTPAVDLILEPGADGGIEAVLERNDGSPLAGVLISLLDRGGRVVRSLVADGRGRRRFEGLPPGDYFVVWADPVAGVGHSPPLQVRSDGAEGPGEPATWRASLPGGAQVSIVCARPECAGATVDLVTLHSAAGLPLGSFLPGVSVGLRLSESGELSLGRIAPGSYTLGLWAAGHRWEIPVHAAPASPVWLALD